MNTIIAIGAVQALFFSLLLQRKQKGPFGISNFEQASKKYLKITSPSPKL